MTRVLFSVLALLGGWSAGRASAADGAWSPIRWNGERALVSISRGWKAVVSLDRGRLVHFGPADRDTNLLFAPPARQDPAGWGGHRLWLGPQSTWATIWPPPAAWEQSGAESHSIEAGVLRLVMPDAGAGWPRLTRIYHWEGTQLVCAAEFSGGSRPAQVIGIIQVPRSTIIAAEARPDGIAPAGYVLLPSQKTPRLLIEFSPPPHLNRDGPRLQFRHIGVILKLGFRPQTLTGRSDEFVLTVSRGSEVPAETTPPDQGFFTQVYLGGPEPFIELEQLSPLYPAGAAVRFTMVLEGSHQ